MNAPIHHVLFDFGDTLAREPFCTLAPPDVPDWESAVLATYDDEGLCDRWCTAGVTFDDVVSRVASRCGLDVETTRTAMVNDWHNLRWNERVLDIAKTLGRSGQAAIVTVNPDIFSTVIVPHYGLDRNFAVIVTSWQERTLDKTALCRTALARLDAPSALDTALLIDNRADLIAAFRTDGGQGYVFTDDDTFARDWPRLSDRLA